MYKYVYIYIYTYMFSTAHSIPRAFSVLSSEITTLF